MKDYMLIFLGTTYEDMDLSPEEIQSRAGQWMSWQEKMEKKGIVKEGNALHAEVRRIAGPERTISDRTSAELKELVGGYYIVQANNFEEAIEIAQDYPDYDLDGTVEVREVLHYN